jgi:hypothetical protein
LHNSIFAFRTSWPYQLILRAIRRDILPFVSAVFLVWLGCVALSHFLFNVADSTGVLCPATDSTKLQELTKSGDRSTAEIIFPTNSICFPTGVFVESGAKYSVTLTEDAPWAHGAIQTHPTGFMISELPDWWMKLPKYATMPLRRVIFRRWFDVIARVGSAGVYEDFVDPIHISDKTYRGSTATTKRSGELFLYVNDAVVGLPWITDLFYRNNHGTAHIVVRRL